MLTCLTFPSSNNVFTRISGLNGSAESLYQWPLQNHVYLLLCTIIGNNNVYKIIFTIYYTLLYFASLFFGGVCGCVLHFIWYWCCLSYISFYWKSVSQYQDDLTLLDDAFKKIRNYTSVMCNLFYKPGRRNIVKDFSFYNQKVRSWGIGVHLKFFQGLCCAE